MLRRAHCIQDRLGLEEVLAAEKPELILGLSGRKGTVRYKTGPPRNMDYDPTRWP